MAMGCPGTLLVVGDNPKKKKPHFRPRVWTLLRSEERKQKIIHGACSFGSL
jgi:hypothetical protein